jgi:ribosome-associated toxin RatA of RatAB toxin-antitoxin module
MTQKMTDDVSADVRDVSELQKAMKDWRNPSQQNSDVENAWELKPNDHGAAHVELHLFFEFANDHQAEH